MKSYTLTIAILMFLVQMGCEGNEYEIEMTPKDNLLSRKLIVRKASPEELERIAKEYQGQGTEEKEGERKFVGTFIGDMPDDVGGAGSYAFLDSPMGSVSIYIERFRGRDDQAERIEELLAACDKFVDILIGWFRQELEDHQGFDQLEKFMDKELRSDIKNVLWVFRIDETLNQFKSNVDLEQDIPIRIGQYLAERDYFAPKDIVKVLKSLDSELAKRTLLPLLRRFVASKMGAKADEPIPTSLAFLADEKSVEKSIERYLRGTETFQQQMAKWKELSTADPNAPEPDPFEQLWDPNLISLDFLSNDSLEVTLVTGTEPFATNGQYDANSQKVIWSHSLEPRDSESDNDLPSMCYAIWDRPDEEFQQRHFGKVVLAGKDLSDYINWRTTLTEKELGEWDKFISELTAGPTLLDDLKAFAFSKPSAATVPAEEEEAEEQNYARHAIEMIIENLQPPEATTQPSTRTTNSTP